MGRLPEMWAGRKITMRVPYEMAGEITLTSLQSGLQFPDATFLHNIDKPFEIHRCKPVVTALDTNGIPESDQPSQETLLQLAKVRITDLGINETITKASTLLALLIKGTAENTWEWAEPRTIVRAENFQIVAEAVDLTNFVADGVLTKLKLSWIFEGFLLIVAPASESR